MNCCVSHPKIECKFAGIAKADESFNMRKTIWKKEGTGRQRKPGIKTGGSRKTAFGKAGTKKGKNEFGGDKAYGWSAGI